MSRFSTASFQTLRSLYQNYGGPVALIKSEYFLLSMVLTGLSWTLAIDDKWAELARGVLPNLAGFSIAAYAIFFVILDERARDSLRKPSEKLGGRSPLLVLVSSISHAVIVQVVAILMAFVIPSKSIPSIKALGYANKVMEFLLGLLGLLATVYGIILVVASILSIYRILELRSKT